MGLFGKGNKARAEDTGAVIDPVCGMKVNPGNAAATSGYQGKTYYFCAPACKKEFDSNPSRFLQGGTAGKMEHGGHGGHGRHGCCG